VGQDVSNESLQWKRQHELHYTANNSRVSCSFICYLFSFLRIFMLQLWGLYSNLRSWHNYFLNKNTVRYANPFSLSQLCNYWISEKSLIFILQSIRVIRSDLSRMCPTVRISSLSDGTDSLFLFWSFYPHWAILVVSPNIRSCEMPILNFHAHLLFVFYTGSFLVVTSTVDLADVVIV
jgi:hypothetical protein